MTDRTLTARIVPALAVLALTAACTSCTLPRPAPRQPGMGTKPAPSRWPRARLHCREEPVTASKNSQNRAPARSSRIGGRQPCRARHSRSLL
jgi:hypothetical protein